MDNSWVGKKVIAIENDTLGMFKKGAIGTILHADLDGSAFVYWKSVTKLAKQDHEWWAWLHEYKILEDNTVMNRTKITLPETLPNPPIDAVYEEILKIDHHEPACVEKWRTPGSRAWASNETWLEEHAGQEIEVDYLKG